MDPICDLLLDPAACVPPDAAQAAEYLRQLEKESMKADPAQSCREAFAHAPLSSDIDEESPEAQLDWGTIFNTLQQTFIEATVYACGSATNGNGDIISFQEQKLSGSFLVLKDYPEKAVLFHVGTGSCLNPTPRQWVAILAGSAPFGVLFTSGASSPKNSTWNEAQAFAQEASHFVVNAGATEG